MRDFKHARDPSLRTLAPELAELVVMLARNRALGAMVRDLRGAGVAPLRMGR